MNKQNKHYQQLTQEPIYQISALRNTGMTLRAIAKIIGVHYCSVSRELRRNATADGYDAKAAQQLSDTRKRTSAKASKSDVFSDEKRHQYLCFGWSPESISGRLTIECNEDNQLSHSTIYRRIEEDKRQGGQLYRLLPRFGKTRWKGGKRNRHAGVGLIPDRVDIPSDPI